MLPLFVIFVAMVFAVMLFTLPLVGTTGKFSYGMTAAMPTGELIAIAVVAALLLVGVAKLGRAW